LTSYSYLEETELVGIKFFRYQPGFMHQKVILVDRKLASIGTANFDNRSMRLNFEVTILLEDPVFAKQVEAMLLADFKVE
jgi:cardiolipin synthase